jgi:hypothetical protein
MLMKKIKLFEELFNRNIDFDKIQQDIDGILIELEDVGYNINIDSNVKYIYFTININKVGYPGINFNIKDIKDYLDTCVDYMSVYYDYKIKVKYIQAFSSIEEEFDNYNLHLDKRLKSFILIFYDISLK